MKQTLLSLLRRIRVYNIARSVYRIAVHRLGFLIGTRLEERRWARSSSPQNGCLTVDHPHRDLILKQMADYIPFQNLLEVGCGTGPNLFLLAKKFPGAIFHGVDINPRFVENGAEWFREQGLSNVTLSVGKADDLSRFTDQSYDIVLTDAVLIYVGPDRIQKVIADLLRIARRAIILVEWHSDSDDPLGFYERHWVRNYKQLIKTLAPDSPVRVRSLSDGGGFEDELWRKRGAIIEAKIEI